MERRGHAGALQTSIHTVIAETGAILLCGRDSRVDFVGSMAYEETLNAFDRIGLDSAVAEGSPGIKDDFRERAYGERDAKILGGHGGGKHGEKRPADEKSHEGQYIARRGAANGESWSSQASGGLPTRRRLPACPTQE